MQALMEELTQEYLRETTPEFAIGDTVDVAVKIREGDKERVQIFNGTVIRRKGAGIHETFTVRRIVQGEGVERIFPLHSPNVQDIVVKKRGRVRRAKLYYLRDRVGKGTRVREKIWVKPAKETEAEAAKKAAEEATTSAEERQKAAAAEAERKAAEKRKAEAERKKKKREKKAKKKSAKKKGATKSDKS